MEHVELQMRPVDYREFVKRRAVVSDFSTLVTEETLFYKDGKPALLYVKLPDALTHNLRVACTKIKYETSTRTGGLKTTSRIFGYSPRNTIRKDFCSATRLAAEQPREHAILCDFGQHLAALYAQYFPEMYARHTEQVEKKVLGEWVVPNSPFTSGIINKNNPLKYHFDSGNLSDVLSNMVVFKNGVSGGYLSCPEYDIGIEVADNTAILFDGQKILHGVTPIERGAPNAYRYSVVYYTLKQMWNCLPVTEEIARIRNVRNIRENKRKDQTITQPNGD